MSTTSDSAKQLSMPLMLPYGKSREYPDAPTSVPFSMLHEAMALRVHNQTLATLSGRGGMDPREMLALMANQYYWDGAVNGIRIRGMDYVYAIAEINKRLSSQ